MKPAKKTVFNGQYRLHDIEHLLHATHEQQSLGFIEKHELIRTTDTYDKWVQSKELF